MAVSKAASLQTVANACSRVVANLTDLNNEYPHTFRPVTLKGELPGETRTKFTFTTTINVNGVPVEVTVRTK